MGRNGRAGLGCYVMLLYLVRLLLSLLLLSFPLLVLVVMVLAGCVQVLVIITALQRVLASADLRTLQFAGCSTTPFLHPLSSRSLG